MTHDEHETLTEALATFIAEIHKLDERYATKQDVADLKHLIDEVRTNALGTNVYIKVASLVAPLLTAIFTALLRTQGWWS